MIALFKLTKSQNLAGSVRYVQTAFMCVQREDFVVLPRIDLKCSLLARAARSVYTTVYAPETAAAQDFFYLLCSVPPKNDFFGSQRRRNVSFSNQGTTKMAVLEDAMRSDFLRGLSGSRPPCLSADRGRQRDTKLTAHPRNCRAAAMHVQHAVETAGPLQVEQPQDSLCFFRA